MRRARAAIALGRAGDLGELLDARARAEYRRRLAELESELAEAESHADLARAERARDERDFIAAELSAALGVGGRPRRSGDPAERARKAVTGRIRLTIGRIDSEHAELARHLTNSVHTGTFCVYRPEDRGRLDPVAARITHRHIRCSASRATTNREEHAMTDTDTTEAELEAQIGAYAERIFQTGLASLEAITISLGRELGLYDHLATEGGVTPGELAQRAGIDGRYAREWLEQQATAGLIDVTASEHRRRSAPLRPVAGRAGVPAAAREPCLGRAADRPHPRRRPGLPDRPRRRLPQRPRHPLRRLRPPRRPGRLQPPRVLEPARVGLAAIDPRPQRPARRRPGASRRDRLRRGMGGDRAGQGLARASRSTGSTTTKPRSPQPASTPPRRASATVFASRSSTSPATCPTEWSRPATTS